MLSKEVCKKCYQDNNWHFDADSREEWDKGRMYCPLFNTGFSFPHIKITDPPHAKCEHRFEHAVAAGMKHA